MYFWDQHKTITLYYEMLTASTCDKYNLKKMEYDINGIKLSGQMPKTSLILKSERSFYFSH